MREASKAKLCYDLAMSEWSKTNKERRKSERKSFDSCPWVFSLYLQEKNIPTEPLRFEPNNISTGGLKFQTNRKIPLFEKIEIHLFEKNTKNDPIRLPAQIIRVEEIDTGLAEKTYGTAAKFIEMSDDNLFKLKKVL